MTSIYDFEVESIEGQRYSLAEYRGEVLLIVNTASKWGFTPQLGELQSLHEQYESRGLRVLAFPCNQFNEQEPGTNAEILEFARSKFGVSFPMHAKIEVNGEGAHPLYVYLRNQAKGVLGTTKIKWNFTKFLVDREGKVVDRFGPPTKPSSLTKKIEALLG